MVVAERPKPKINLSILPEMKDVFLEMAGRKGERKKWIASTGAIFLWLKLSEADREALAQKMVLADTSDEHREKLLQELGLGETFDKDASELSQPAASPAGDSAKPGRRRSGAPARDQQAAPSGRAKSPPDRGR